MSLDVSRELAVVQCGVTAAAFQQFMMVAVLDDVTMFHIQNQVRVTDRRQPVRDDEAGASCHQSCHGFADFRLGPVIDGAGSLVEYQDRRVRKEDAGDGEQLALSDRQVPGLVVEYGIVAVRQRAYEVVGAHGFGRRDDLLAGRIWRCP